MARPAMRVCTVRCKASELGNKQKQHSSSHTQLQARRTCCLHVDHLLQTRILTQQKVWQGSSGKLARTKIPRGSMGAEDPVCDVLHQVPGYAQDLLKLVPARRDEHKKRIFLNCGHEEVNSNHRNN